MPVFKRQKLGKIIPHASKDALGLIEKMLKYNPEHRPNADELMHEDFFVEVSEQYINLERGKTSHS
jgi:serine/threonine protein kinase